MNTTRLLTALAALMIVSAVGAASAYGHAERLSYYPNHKLGSVPKYKRTGSALVVCKTDSGARIRRLLSGRAERRNLALLKRCGHRDIQAAVDAADNGTRIFVLPGVYREEPSRRVAEPAEACSGDHQEYDAPGYDDSGTVRVPNYEYQRKCPNAQNLIAIIGDGPDADRRCDHKCNIQIEGTGTKPGHVLIDGSRRKLNVIRADRADGIHLRNFTVQFSDFNNGYVLETNGFRMENIVSRWSRESASCHSPPTTASTASSRPMAPATPASIPAPGPRATASATASRSTA